MWAAEIPDVKCEDICRIAEQYPVQDGGTFAQNESDPNRRSKVRWLNDCQEVAEILWDYVQRANQVLNVDVEPLTDIQFTEYHATHKGFYGDHHDVDWTRNDGKDRKLSIVVQLSRPDDYEGGYFQFGEVQSPFVSDFSQRGSILVFPSYLRHHVTPVTKGIRKSLVAWFEGPQWK